MRSSTLPPAGVAAAKSSSARPAARLRSSGRGWDDSRHCIPGISVRSTGTAPSGATTSPRRRRSPRASTAPCIIAEEAFPTAKALTGPSNRPPASAARTRRRPSTAAIAVRKRSSRSSRRGSAGDVSKGTFNDPKWRGPCVRPAGPGGAATARRPSGRARSARGIRGSRRPSRIRPRNTRYRRR